MLDEQKYRIGQIEKKQERDSERITELERFKYSTIEKLKTIFERLKDLEKSSKWVSQSFFYLILSGAIGAVFSLIGWLITR